MPVSKNPNAPTAQLSASQRLMNVVNTPRFALPAANVLECTTSGTLDESSDSNTQTDSYINTCTFMRFIPSAGCNDESIDANCLDMP